jgi:hypothetical protein
LANLKERKPRKKRKQRKKRRKRKERKKKKEKEKRTEIRKKGHKNQVSNNIHKNTGYCMCNSIKYK